MSIDKQAQSIRVTDEIEVDGLLCRPESAKALIVLAHGAGAGMDHRGIVGLAEALAEHRIASLRYQGTHGRGRMTDAAILDIELNHGFLVDRDHLLEVLATLR